MNTFYQTQYESSSHCLLLKVSIEQMLPHQTLIEGRNSIQQVFSPVSSNQHVVNGRDELHDSFVQVQIFETFEQVGIPRQQIKCILIKKNCFEAYHTKHNN